MVEIRTGSHKMGQPEGFLSTMRRSVAVMAIGPSSLRNQGVVELKSELEKYVK
jgi:hypothetical protein